VQPRTFIADFNADLGGAGAATGASGAGALFMADFKADFGGEAAGDAGLSPAS